METESLFISCGANTAPGGILWLDLTSSVGGTERYLAYASHHMIALVNFTMKVPPPLFLSLPCDELIEYRD